MGSCASKAKTDALPVQKPQDLKRTVSVFKNKKADDILKDAQLSTQFRNLLKKKNPITGEYFACAEMIAKRKALYQSGQRCGDDREKGQEILATWAKEIITTYAALPFDFDGKFSDLQTEFATQPIEDIPVDGFDGYSDKALRHVTSW
ncbi:hypothetical protein HDU91_002709 [Kappamyces sp. JEL0680]|nr:hypothetical protein HDU91_002709 [Kappamyces sp. JEL0680]